MHYTQLFRSLRETRGLTIEGLAELAGCHRNTVTNVESGRPVKFKTIADLMEKMGYPLRSSEMKSLALLWLEAVSHIPFSQPRTEDAAVKSIARYRKSIRESAHQLETEAVNCSLAVHQIDLLIFAIRHPEMLAILGNIRDLVQELAAPPEAPSAKAAEDKN